MSHYDFFLEVFIFLSLFSYHVYGTQFENYALLKSHYCFNMKQILLLHIAGMIWQVNFSKKKNCELWVFANVVLLLIGPEKCNEFHFGN